MKKASDVDIVQINLSLPETGGEGLDASWFEALFNAHGLSASIRSVSANPIGGGLMGSNYRYLFDYDGRDPGVPDSLIGKFPSAEERTRQSQGVALAYAQEVNFYQQFSSTAGVIAPSIWYCARTQNALENISADFVIILEDLSPLKSLVLADGCGFDEACLAMEMAASLHASHWNDKSLEHVSWLSEGGRVLPPEIMQNCWQEFLRRFAEKLTPEQQQTGERFVAAFPAWRQGHKSSPLCLVHRDFRIENVLFGDAGSARKAAVVDWQLVDLEAPAIDIAFFIGPSVHVDVRREYEQKLLTHYFETMVKAGVTDYRFEDFQTHYAWYSFWGIMVAVGSMMFASSPDGDRMLWAMFRRQVALILDNGFLSLLDDLPQDLTNRS